MSHSLSSASSEAGDSLNSGRLDHSDDTYLFLPERLLTSQMRENKGVLSKSGFPKAFSNQVWPAASFSGNSGMMNIQIVAARGFGSNGVFTGCGAGGPETSRHRKRSQVKPT